MSPKVFEEALLSMRGWPGVIALFGGNPCTHPQFPELCEIMVRMIPNQAQRGIWTNNLMKHGELVKQTFWPNGRFNLNVHHEAEAAAEMRKWLPGWPIYGEHGRDHHGAVLLKYQDYGLTYDQWAEKREKCDINQNWSSAIFERDGRAYAYFCEMCGSIDGIRGQNNGIPVEPGWWAWAMDRFQHQVGACCDQGCGVPLKMPGRGDREDVYTISPSWEQALEERAGKVSLEVRPQYDGQLHELTDYIGLRLNQ